MGIWPVVRFDIFVLYGKIIQLYDYVYLTLHQTVAVGRAFEPFFIIHKYSSQKAYKGVKRMRNNTDF